MRAARDSESATLEQLDALGLSREQQSRAYEARAKITWGESTENVEVDLIAGGVSPRLARDIVNICVRERSSSMRRKGVRDLVIGAVIMGLAFLASFVLVMSAYVGRLWGIPITFFVAGTLVLFRGLERLIFGARADGPDSDLREWD